MSELTGPASETGRAMEKAADAMASDIPAVTEATADDAVVRRTKDGWRVGDADLPDLTSAMVLADLISAELAQPGATGPDTAADGMAAAAAATVAAGTAAEAAGTAVADAANSGQARNTLRSKGKVRGKSKDPAASETSKLRATIGQLEHALTARIRVEQAIGVLAERHRIQPRQAFEQLRSAARSRGRRVIDIASDVVASATNPLLQLPDELSRPRSVSRQGRRNRQAPGILSSE
ncbi:MAG TPA: ANTAR domain-containing protein [Streptosporangiaceae bacterium]|nr:ANTAR domain-containing protein [Streptosporangiaceae bacterium]